MRWHAPNCRRPKVYVAADDVPACRRCGQSAGQVQPPKEDSLFSPFSMPPDEPAGQLNLSWPPCVPYSANVSVTEIGEASTGEASLRPEPRTSELSDDGIDTSWRDHTYERTLSPNEFRVACLGAVPAGSTKSYPVHLSFDVFEDDHHPDYDTVSYTWGGEDDDKTQSFPIYIGDFWDVLHATRNCQSVLRYLRPFRGTKLIWLDFICINQRNMHEKSHQIAKMGQIYSQCNQATVWLGEDIVSHDQADLPSFRQLAEDEDLEEILTRRYFTRVWVIQELVLSPRLVIPFRDVVIRIGPLDIIRSRQETLEKSQAPWFRFATQGIKEMSQTWNNSWIEAMRSTSTAKSSDLRDGLYGVIGLWPSGQNELVADYSISYQHMMMGLFAHRLVHHHENELFWAARGINFPELDNATPSWAPPFQMQGFWEWLSRRTSRPETLLHSRFRTASRQEFHFGTGRPWQEQATVDPQTGGLCLLAVKVFSIPPQSQHCDAWSPNYLDQLGGLEYREDIQQNGADLFCLRTASIVHKDSTGPICLLLRRLGPRRYKFVERIPEFKVMIRSLRQADLTLQTVRERISLSIATLKSVWDTPMHLLDEKLGMGALVFELLQVFPGHRRTRLREFLPVLCGIRNPGYLLENPSARAREARIRPVRAYPDGAVILRFSGLDRDAIKHHRFAGMPACELPWDCYYDQRDPDAERRDDRDRGLKFVSLKRMDLRWEEDVYAACPISEIRSLLDKIRWHLNIGAIWNSLDTVNPGGRWSELLQAESLYPENLVDLRWFRKFNDPDFNKRNLTAVEQRIEIV